MNYRDRRCPYCGRTTGLYTLEYIYNTVTALALYGFDGHSKGECFQNANKEGGDKMYCQACGEYICRKADYEKLYPKED